jgi:hypothetical protein
VVFELCLEKGMAFAGFDRGRIAAIQRDFADDSERDRIELGKGRGARAV